AGAGADARRALGRDRRFCRDCRLPGRAGVGFPHRCRHPRRWRVLHHGMRPAARAKKPRPEPGLETLGRDQYFATTAAGQNFQFALAMTSPVSTLTSRYVLEKANTGAAAGIVATATTPELN